MREVKVGTAVFVQRNGKFLMLQRMGSHGSGSWATPGGHLEFGESWEACAKREIMEETGMHIKNIQFLTATNDIFTTENKHYTTIWLTADWAANEPKIMEPHKIAAFKWTTFKALPKPLFEPCWANLRAARPDLFS